MNTGFVRKLKAAYQNQSGCRKIFCFLRKFGSLKSCCCCIDLVACLHKYQTRNFQDYLWVKMKALHKHCTQDCFQK